jgi:hypothetical protein
VRATHRGGRWCTHVQKLTDAHELVVRALHVTQQGSTRRFRRQPLALLFVRLRLPPLARLLLRAHRAACQSGPLVDALPSRGAYQGTACIVLSVGAGQGSCCGDHWSPR